MSEFDEFDEINYPRPMETGFGDILDRAMTRRGFLGSSAKLGAASFIVSTGLVGLTSTARAESPSMGFEAVKATTADAITLPPGYESQVVVRWGDPLWSTGSEFDQATRGTGESQELAFGDNCDGMMFYPLSDTSGVMAVNNEYTNRNIICPDGINTADDVRKVKAGHGVSVFEVALTDGKWQHVVDSKYNRKYTADAEMEITGPARGDALMKTAADPTGTRSLGTWNNCGNGTTPWGTYLACEENFNGYFGSTDEAHEPTANQKRYGVGNKDWKYNWYKFDERFDISKEANECNRAGYIVEIDPMDPTGTPKKRTAMGRFKHENAAIVIAESGHAVGYMGDDERGEYLYKFVSRNKYVEGDDAANKDLLADGTLYVARFGEADDNLAGKGEWVELTHGKNGIDAAAGFASQAEVCIHARLAADVVGATTMDRPEWVAANPNNNDVYVTLTNNKNRGKKPNRGGVETPVGGPNPRESNQYGQIVRWSPEGGDHTANGFDWNLFVVAGNPTLHEDLYGGSDNVTEDNMFNSPDGLLFDVEGRLWIQTDGNYSNEKDFAGMGNNQMLCADTNSGEIRRFMVGPIACEVTGAAWSSDRTTMFVGIQHPGEKDKPSHWPDGGDSVPRSSIVAVRRTDGGIIGA